MDDKSSVQASAMMDFCVRSFVKCGLSGPDAAVAADTLVQAELRGIDSHGIVRLPFYCRRLIKGGTNPSPKVAVIAEKPALLLMDGDNGLGQIVGVRAMEAAIARAKNQGICFVGVRNSCHFGMTAYYPLLGVRHDMIGLAGCNTATVMAPWGGGKSAIGNNPLAIVVPTGKPYPLVLDMAMSVVSGGKVRLEAIKGSKIPLGWILDEKGRPTEDPKDLFPNGTLMPLGHKGFGLAIMVEILAGVLTGAAILKEIPLWFERLEQPVALGHFFLAVDIGSLLPIDHFKRRVDGLIDELKGSPPMEGSAGVMMPGEPEYLCQKRRSQEGIPVSPQVLQMLDDFSREIAIHPMQR